MTKSNGKSKLSGLEIAVIGMAGRFPGAKDIDSYWENLKNGVESITFFSDDELLESGIPAESISKPNYIKAKGYIEDVQYFDSSFFNYNPREAEIMDPQVRIFHQCAWHALENAGYDPYTYNGLIGLVAGYEPDMHWKVSRYMQSKNGAELMELRSLNSSHFTSNICYKLNLKGPALSINTTCSTSLVAIHVACRSLLTGETDIALAGGVCLTYPTKSGYFYEEGMIHSADGRCYPFDARATGMASGNGAGVVVLKRLVKALKDRDYIYAVIKGSAINNDGKRKAGYSAPSLEGQIDVIRSALKFAQVEPGTISYIETHGTGTPIGDTIEFEALKKAFWDPAGKISTVDTTSPIKDKSCAIGFVKANIGHMDSAAGVAGFIKTALALNHRIIPPAVNFNSPNPKIDLENSPFYINKTAKDWISLDSPLRAGVSGYGIGGTNAHIILEEAPEDTPIQHSPDNNTYRLIPISAKSRSALDHMTQNLAKYLKENPGISIANVAYSLQIGRSAFNYRRILVCKDIEEAINALLAPALESLCVNVIEIEEDCLAKELNRFIESEYASFIEKGPGKDPASPVIKLLNPVQKEIPDMKAFMEKIGQLWLLGGQIDWTGFYSDAGTRRIPLPLYPFDKTPYTVDIKSNPLTDGGNIEIAKPSFLTVNRPEMKTPYVAPQNRVEGVFSRIWEELLGIQPIGINDNLVELGVDSLKAMMFVNRFKEQFAEVIPVTDVFASPTVKEFAANFCLSYPDSPLLIRTETPTTPVLPSNFIMLHRPRNGVGNVFFIHEVCGDVGAYLEFCKHSGTRFNCWGIEAEKLKNYLPIQVTISDVASHYIKQIKSIQPKGPYYLATWSLGGNFGFEVALQLEKMGEQIGMLAFFDCMGPNGRIPYDVQEFTLENEINYVKGFFSGGDFQLDFDQLQSPELLWNAVVGFFEANPALLPVLRDFLKSLAQAIPDYNGLSAGDLIQFHNISRTFRNASAVYTPLEKLQTPIQFFAATHEKVEEYWNEYCHTPMVYHPVHGDHHSIFRDKDHIPPFAQTFNNVLESCFNNLKPQ